MCRKLRGRGDTNLVDHHYCKQVANSGKEKPIKIVLDAVADGVTKDVQNDLSDDKKEDTKDNVTERPAVLKGTHNENDLADEVDEEEDCVDKIRDDEDANGVFGTQTSPVLESEEGDGASNDEHGEGGQAQEPDRQSCAVFIQLETNKAVDQQAGAEGRDEAILGGSKVWVGGGARRSDTGVENERYDSEEEVDVEEGSDLLAPCCCMSARWRMKG